MFKNLKRRAGSAVMALAMLLGVGSGVALTTGVIENSAIEVNAATKNTDLFNETNTSYTKIYNNETIYCYTVNLKTYKMYVEGNFKLTTKNGSLEYIKSCKTTYNSGKNRTYITVTVNPEAYKNYNVTFDGKLTNNGKTGNFRFKIKCNLYYKWSQEKVGVGYWGDFNGVYFLFEKPTKGSNIISVSSTNSSVVRPETVVGSPSVKARALKTGTAKIKVKFACGLCVYTEYNVVTGKEYKSAVTINKGATKSITAQKDIHQIYSLNSSVAQWVKTDGRKYSIKGRAKGQTDIYVWYTDGTHSCIRFTVK